MEIDEEINLVSPTRTQKQIDLQSPGAELSPYSRAIYDDIKKQIERNKAKEKNKITK